MRVKAKKLIQFHFNKKNIDFVMQKVQNFSYTTEYFCFDFVISVYKCFVKVKREIDLLSLYNMVAVIKHEGCMEH